jgi:hypothetical protein
MYQKTKPRSGHLPPAQEHHDDYALSDIEGQKSQSPKRIPDFSRIHPNRDEGGDGKKDTGARKPTLRTADFIGADRGA